MADKFLKSLQLEEGGDTYFPLPIVGTDDNGKILKVVNGEWVKADPTGGDIQTTDDGNGNVTLSIG